jgi:hypothetical protein
VAGTGHVAREDRDRLPLCVDCLTLLLEDVRRFRDGMPGSAGG